MAEEPAGGPVLITGGAGFIGGALARRLVAGGHDVVTLDRAPARGPGRHVDGDVTDAGFVRHTIDALRPGAVYHLAGTSSEADLGLLHRLNALAAVHLCEALAAARPDAVVVVAGSAAEYGVVPPHELPAAEERRLAPVTHYGASKAMQTLAVLPFARSGLRVVVARLANVIGPSMPRTLALGRWLQLVRDQLSAGRARIVTGPLGAVRDFIDVADVVDLLPRLARADASAGRVVNVCSGRPTTLRELALGLRAAVARRLPGFDLAFDEEPGLARPGPDEFVADPALLASLVGPVALTPLERTLDVAVADELRAA